MSAKQTKKRKVLFVDNAYQKWCTSIMKNKHIGIDFDNFLKEENILEETQAAAIKKVLAYQIKEIMKQKHMTKSILTKKMNIKNRNQVDRLLDPDNKSVTLLTLGRVATALGKKLEVSLL